MTWSSKEDTSFAASRISIQNVHTVLFCSLEKGTPLVSTENLPVQGTFYLKVILKTRSVIHKRNGTCTNWNSWFPPQPAPLAISSKRQFYPVSCLGPKLWIRPWLFSFSHTSYLSLPALQNICRLSHFPLFLCLPPHQAKPSSALAS